MDHFSYKKVGSHFYQKNGWIYTSALILTKKIKGFTYRRTKPQIILKDASISGSVYEGPQTLTDPISLGSYEYLDYI